MIIKSLSRKSPSFDQLTAYMLAEKGARVTVAHNLPPGAQSTEVIIRAFEENHALLPRRANGNALFHEIIALPPNLDVPVRAQAEALADIAARYLDLRAGRQMAVGVIHRSTAHVHIHVMISSNAVLSKQRVWLTKKDFAEIQREIEAYRLARNPELGSARHYEQANDGAKRGNREQAATLRTGKPSRKQEIAAAVRTAMREAKGQDVLTKALEALGLTLYPRGRSVGVMTENGKRYRLGTLGLGEPYTEAEARFELVESRMASLQKWRTGRDHVLER